MIWLQATIGRGPEECEIALKGILNELIKEVNEASLKYEILDSETSNNGIKSALLRIEGANLNEFTQSWNGSIQWLCKSPVRPLHKRKRWFVSVTLLQIAENNVGYDVKDSDLIWESMKASGPGGQHVNKTESAVRLTHKTSGTVVTASEERSQHRNKSLALAKLYSQFEQNKNKQVAADARDRWNNHNTLQRGNAVRTYEGLNFKHKQ